MKPARAAEHRGARLGAARGRNERRAGPEASGGGEGPGELCLQHAVTARGPASGVRSARRRVEPADRSGGTGQLGAAARGGGRSARRRRGRGEWRRSPAERRRRGGWLQAELERSVEFFLNFFQYLGSVVAAH